MSYVLQRNDDGKYVTPAGSDKSYSDKLQNARFYKTREDAKCGNEMVVEVGK